MGSVQGLHTSTEAKARAILEQVVALGGVVTWADGLKVHSAAGIPQDVREQWAAHKADILALLTQTIGPCEVCGAEGYIYSDDGRPLCEEHEGRGA